MKAKSLFVVLTFLVVALLLGGCDVLAGVDTEAIGTEAHPIKMMFVPSHDAESLIAGGDVLADTLQGLPQTRGARLQLDLISRVVD